MDDTDNTKHPTPKPTPVLLPEVKWIPSPNFDSRHGHPVNLVVVHRWGASSVPVPLSKEKISWGGVINWFENRSSQVSAHLVFPGSAGGVNANGRMNCTQMVAWNDMAWAEAAYNPVADDIESADDIWLGADPEGLAVLARIVACRLRARDLPAVWSTTKGFCRHADLGSAGGGHTSCPTTDLITWRHFVKLVKAEYERGGFEPAFGR